MAKTKVNGKRTEPVFGFLKSRLSGFAGSFIKWNFTKFVVDAQGRPVKRFGPKDDPFAMEADIVALLDERDRHLGRQQRQQQQHQHQQQNEAAATASAASDIAEDAFGQGSEHHDVVAAAAVAAAAGGLPLKRLSSGERRSNSGHQLLTSPL